MRVFCHWKYSLEILCLISSRGFLKSERRICKFEPLQHVKFTWVMRVSLPSIIQATWVIYIGKLLLNAKLDRLNVGLPIFKKLANPIKIPIPSATPKHLTIDPNFLHPITPPHSTFSYCKHRPKFPPSVCNLIPNFSLTPSIDERRADNIYQVAVPLHDALSDGRFLSLRRRCEKVQKARD